MGTGVQLQGILRLVVFRLDRRRARLEARQRSPRPPLEGGVGALLQLAGAGAATPLGAALTG